MVDILHPVATLFLMSNNAAAEPATIVQQILVGFGHSLSQDADGCYHLKANPERCGPFGEIPAVDWEAATAPVYTCAPPGERRESWARHVGLCPHRLRP